MIRRAALPAALAAAVIALTGYTPHPPRRPPPSAGKVCVSTVAGSAVRCVLVDKPTVIALRGYAVSSIAVGPATSCGVGPVGR